MDEELEKLLGKWDAVRGEDRFTYKKAKSSNQGFDCQYWNDVYKSSKGEVLNEGKKKNIDFSISKQPQSPNKKIGSKEYLIGADNEDDGVEDGDLATQIGKQPNPIQYPSVGDDARRHITPTWAAGVELQELSDMKASLEKLESRMNQYMGMAEDKEAKKVASQIKNLWKKIDELSDKLTPKFINDRMS
jgi:hypothetical protein